MYYFQPMVENPGTTHIGEEGVSLNLENASVSDMMYSFTK